MKSPRVVVIGGPTASGKSKKALQIAEKEGGRIINADSQQLYEGLPILTDQPKQEGPIQHDLYGVLPYNQPSINAAAWSVLAQTCIQQALDAHLLPIVVGGTGFYLKTLVRGLSPIPSMHPEEKKSLYERFSSLETKALFQDLFQKDPATAERLSPLDRQRIQRALSVFYQTGRPLSYWHTLAPMTPTYTFDIQVCLPAVHTTKEAIADRFDIMKKEGVVDEVLSFHRRPHVDASPLQAAIGFSEVLAYGQGLINWSQCQDLYGRHCHQYAKRQRTWFRKFP